MADWPPVAPVQPTLSPQEKEKVYLMLVDMFVDILDPEIIQMVLVNRNWDVDAALENIMMMTNSPQPSSAQNASKPYNAPKISNQPKARNSTNAVHREEAPFKKSFQPYGVGKVSTNPQNVPQSKSKKQTPDKPFHHKTPETRTLNQLQLQPFIEQYNYIKATRSPFDRAVMLVKDGIKVMIILRGPSGSGKSSLAKKLLLESGIEPSAHKRHIFSADDFFVQNKVYVFVPELLSQAHLWNQRSVAAAIREDVSPVIIDNTNTQSWEMRVYADMAVSAGYDLEIIEPDTWWFRKGSVSELEKRNIHSVPKAKIRLMMERYEKNITPDMLIKQFNLQYPLSKAPPQPSRNCKWRDKLSNQRNNKPKKKKSDLSTQPQSNLDNFNTRFQSIQTHSSGFSTFGNEFTVQNSSSTNFCFPPQVNSNEMIMKDESKTSSHVIENSEDTNISSSYKKDGITKSFSFDESETNKLFDDLIINSSGLLKSLSGYSNSSQDSGKAPLKTNGSFSTGNNFHKVKDTFDFMAETKKLLDALNRPSVSYEPLKQSPDLIVDETKDNFESLKADESGAKSIIADNSTSFSGSYETNDLSKENNFSSKEKTNFAHGLIDSIIDKAAGLEDAKAAILTSSPTTIVEKVQETGERGLYWDYVIVNKDNTFTYQKNNSIPIGLPVMISDGVVSRNIHVNNCTIPMTELDHFETNGVDAKAISSDDLYESDSATIENESCISCSADRKDDLFVNFLEGKSKVCRDNTFNQLGNSEQSVLKIYSEVSTTKESFHDEPVKKDLEQIQNEKSENTENTLDNSNMFEMMKDILCTLAPLNDNSNSLSVCNDTSHLQDTNTLDHSECGITSPSAEKLEHPFTAPLSDTFLNCNRKSDSTANDMIANDKSPPKPARNLRRPKLFVNAAEHQFIENDFSKYFGNWSTVSNPAETWVMEKAVHDCSGLNNEVSPLPQRSSSQPSKYNKVVDSATNTNYLDFTYADEENASGVKILMGNGNNFLGDNVPKLKQNISETLFLDKSTMTVEDAVTPVCNYDITQIKHLFPNIHEKYILDVIEKCRGDIDWAVDVLLDSEHNIAPLSIELDNNSNSSNDDVLEQAIKQPKNDHINSLKREPRIPSLEQTELKKFIESSVVFDRSHYSDKVLKVMKRKHPEYVQLIQNSPAPDEKTVEKAETADCSQDGCKTEDEVDEVEEESSSSGCEVETEDDTMDLIMSNDLILQLQQKFGSSSLPKITEMTPIVKLPLSFARELFGYIMDSLQSDMDQQQSNIEDLIAKDEEVARLLQFQDKDSRPQLQEVMDMEIALAMHKADQEELNGKSNEDTVAAKLSTNILLEKFPQVDPKMLKEVFQVHNFSLSDTVAFLTLELGVGPASSTQELPKEEKERVTSILVSDEMDAAASADSSANPMTEAAAHRAQAASYYSLRMECLSKAHDAFRSGNKTVATYYSQLAQMHKERMEQSNCKAAACLFSSHKTGANTLDLHFLHIREAEVVLDMFLDEVVTYISERNKRHQMVFLITGRGLRSVGGVSRIKPMVQRKLQGRGIPYNEVNPGMLSALVRNVTPLSYTL